MTDDVELSRGSYGTYDTLVRRARAGRNIREAEQSISVAVAELCASRLELLSVEASRVVHEFFDEEIAILDAARKEYGAAEMECEVEGRKSTRQAKQLGW